MRTPGDVPIEVTIRSVRIAQGNCVQDDKVCALDL